MIIIGSWQFQYESLSFVCIPDVLKLHYVLFKKEIIQLKKEMRGTKRKNLWLIDCIWIYTWGGYFPIFGHGREVPQWWSLILRFSIWMVPYFMTHNDLIDLSFCRTKLVCLYHIWFQRYLGFKFDIMFHQNVLFNSF